VAIATTSPAGTAYGEEYSFTTDQGSLDAPQNLSITLEDGQIRLSWSSVIGATSYKIYRSSDPYTEDWGAPIALTGSTSWIEAIPTQHYFYRVTASNEIVRD